MNSLSCTTFDISHLNVLFQGLHVKSPIRPQRILVVEQPLGRQLMSFQMISVQSFGLQFRRLVGTDRPNRRKPCRRILNFRFRRILKSIQGNHGSNFGFGWTVRSQLSPKMSFLIGEEFIYNTHITISSNV